MAVIKHAVIPVAGFGTRFLPATKSIPKELFPIVDKPIIQYAVQEAYEAGIKNFIFVNNPNKSSVDAHFRFSEELEKHLQDSGKLDYLQSLLSLREHIRIDTVLQDNPLGLGHAILCAKDMVGNNDFAVILPKHCKPSFLSSKIFLHDSILIPLFATQMSANQELPPP